MKNSEELNTFGIRLNILRISHSILAKEMAIILKMQYRNYLRYEKNEMDPSMSKIKAISDLFGINSDWLIGRSNEMYSESAISLLEEKLIEIAIQLPIVVPESYQNEELRKATYSLAERGKLVFLFNVLNYEVDKGESKKVKKYIAELEEIWSE